MNKIGYAIVSLLMLGMLWYLFIYNQADREFRVFADILPHTFTLRSADWQQEISNGSLVINNIQRILEAGKVKTLRRYLHRMRVRGDRIIADVAVADLSAYGITDTNELRFDQQRYRWGISGQTGYIWNENSANVYVVSDKVVTNLNRYSGRFDDQTLVSGLGQVQTLDTGAVKLTRVSVYGGWMADDQQDRPPFTSRGNKVMGFLKGLKCMSLTGVDSTGAQEIQRIQLSMTDASEHTYIFLQRDAEYFVAVDALPVQKISQRQWRTLEGHLKELDKDYLFDFPMGMEGLPFDRIIIQHGGVENFRLQRYGVQDESYDIAGYSYWSVQWSGGREAADSEAAYRFFALFNYTPVTDTQLQPAEAPTDAKTVSIILMDGEEKELARMDWSADNTLQAKFYRAKIDAEYLSEIPIEYKQLFNGSSFLNPYLLPADARRIEKIQRLYYPGRDVNNDVPYQGELLVKQSQSNWQRTLYDTIGGVGRTEDADGMACSRLAMTLVNMKALSVELVNVDNMQEMKEPQYGFDLRLSAWGDQKGDDDQLLEETLARDWGMSLKYVNDQWWAMSRAQTVRYQLADEDVQSLLGGIQDTYLFSGIVSHIRSIDIQLIDDAFTLKRKSNAWNVLRAGEEQAADQLQIRRFLKDVSGLRAVDIDEAAPVISAAQAEAIVAISQLGIDEIHEQVTLFVSGLTGESAYVQVSAQSSSGAHPFSGVARVQRAQIMTLIRQHAWFLRGQEKSDK